MKNIIAVSLILLPICSSATHLDFCDGKESVKYNTLENDEVQTPVFLSNLNVCIEDVINKTVVKGKFWRQSDSRPVEYRLNYTFRDYIAVYPDGYKCIDVYAETYSELADMRRVDSLDLYTKSLYFIVGNTLGAVKNTVDSLNRKQKVIDFLRKHQCR
ncbi:MAG: hypothetical protein MK008_09220 [Bdellovibrionales bacterium]|nr:hypothetical protein [Bdellovibrionales bacterium]